MNTAWRLVNIDNSGVKRDVSGKDKEKKKSENEKNTQGFIKDKWEEFKKDKNEKDAWKQLVDWECQNTPQIELTEQFEAWLDMTGLGPELWDRDCDPVSAKWEKKHGKNQVNGIDEGQDKHGQHQHRGQHHGGHGQHGNAQHGGHPHNKQSKKIK